MLDPIYCGPYHWLWGNGDIVPKMALCCQMIWSAWEVACHSPSLVDNGIRELVLHVAVAPKAEILGNGPFLVNHEPAMTAIHLMRPNRLDEAHLHASRRESHTHIPVWSLYLQHL